MIAKSSGFSFVELNIGDRKAISNIKYAKKKI